MRSISVLFSYAILFPNINVCRDNMLCSVCERMFINLLYDISIEYFAVYADAHKKAISLRWIPLKIRKILFVLNFIYANINEYAL